MPVSADGLNQLLKPVVHDAPALPFVHWENCSCVPPAQYSLSRYWNAACAPPRFGWATVVGVPSVVPSNGTLVSEPVVPVFRYRYPVVSFGAFDARRAREPDSGNRPIRPWYSLPIASEFWPK